MPASERIRVKFLSRIRLPDGNIGRDFLRRFPGRAPVLSNCEFIFDPAARDYDWLVVYDDLPRDRPEELLGCPPENTLLLTGEPSSITVYGRAFLRQFGHVLTSQEPRALFHPGVIRRQAGLLWYYGGTDRRGALDTLAAATPPAKTKLFSTVCSRKAMKHTLHSLRLEFTLRLKSEVPELDVFGYGMGKLDDKADALDAYKYHLAIENHSCDHHWTEKLADAYLGFCLPLYFGCTNLDSYFPRDSYIWIDIRDPGRAIAEIKRVLRSDEYERRLPAILEARRRVLEEYSTFHQLAKIISSRDRGLRGSPIPPTLLRRRQKARLRQPVSALRELAAKTINKTLLHRALVTFTSSNSLSQAKPSTRAVAVIDWNTTGHHPTYLREYVLALLAGGRNVVVLSAERPAVEFTPGRIVWREIPSMRWIKARKFFTTRIARRLYANHIRSLLRDAEAELGMKCDRILLGCLHEAQSYVCARVVEKIGLPAAGLYVQAGIFYRQGLEASDRRARKVRTLLKIPGMETIFMLDAAMIEPVRAFSGRTVTLLPDVTDTRVEEEHPILSQLGLKPKRRPVIGLLGHLRPSKGVVELLRFLKAAPDLDITVLLAGECRWAEFSREDEAVIRQAIADDKRIIFHPERIPEEPAYNALACASDILWAVYRDCPHSSNTLVKAAAFHRPVLVAEGYVMAQETREFGLGEVVSPEDFTGISRAIQNLLADMDGWRQRHQASRDEFSRRHTNEEFATKINAWARGLD